MALKGTSALQSGQPLERLYDFVSDDYASTEPMVIRFKHVEPSRDGTKWRRQGTKWGRTLTQGLLFLTDPECQPARHIRGGC
ncbi:unnamed protein product [Protopolystoma xenopodis]|uniref:Uncharacterized protein n=1 Tax=Protopolystoma xenopodis TaxID=117903 RepID=A0A3S5BWJ7_9PLAT|nr:unnamed protein product [Protopolystoma xenopodis]